MFDEKLLADLLFLDDITALRAMDVFSTSAPSMPVRAKNPQEVWGAFCNSRIGIFGPPQCVQMDKGGEWGNEVWAESHSERRIKSLLLSVGARR